MIKNKIIFFGTSDFGVPILELLLKKKYHIELIITQPDRKNRNKKILFSRIKEIALKNNIKILQPKLLLLDHIGNYQADLGILVAYGQIIKPEIINFFKYGILNIHPSLLPKYRGPSPIQTAILNNDQEIGTTIMKLDRGLDSGPILAQNKIKLANQDDCHSISAKLSCLSAELLALTLEKYLTGTVKPRKQNNLQATYSKKIDKKDGEINSEMPPKIIYRKYLAYSDWPGIYFFHNQKRFIIKKMHVVGEKIIIDLIQPEGKKIMSYSEFIKGYKDINF